jgi:hypothetical protein
MDKTPEQIERENLIVQNIAQFAEIAALNERIRHLEHNERYYETRTHLLTQVQVITFSVGEASREEKIDSFDEILGLLQTDARA